MGDARLNEILELIADTLMEIRDDLGEISKSLDDMNMKGIEVKGLDE